jgi:hypothetical protein
MSTACTAPTGAGPELYVATNLDTWEAKPPVARDQDEMCESCGFRRLDPQYYAWLRSRMALAQKLHGLGQLPAPQFEALRTRFNAVHAWAIDRFGEAALLAAVRSLDAARYAPPSVRDEPTEAAPVTRAPDHVWPADGDWPLAWPVPAEAVAMVDAIRDQASALGWPEAALYQNRGRLRFPVGEYYGLVCFLDPGDRINAVTRESIEIIRTTGSRQHFYNREIDQPWRRQVRSCAEEAEQADTSASVPVCMQHGSITGPTSKEHSRTHAA